MSFAPFKVLTFDVVGTLIDFETGILNHVRSVGGAVAATLGDDEILGAYRTARDDPEAGWFPDDLVRVYKQMAAKLGLPDAPGFAEGLRDSVVNWPAFPDSVEALKRLRKRFRLVAMTNARHWALDHMSRTLGDPFDDRVSVDDVRFEKPDPQYFAFVRGRLSTLGLQFEDILHVAQSQYHDIGVAKKLGYKVCWIERRKGLKGFGGTLAVAELTQPDYHFTTLAGLADAIDAESSLA